VVTKITGRHMEITEAIRSLVEKKIDRLNRYHDRITEIEVILEKEGLLQKLEIIVKADKTQPFIVRQDGDDMYACLDKALDRIERQMVKHKERVRHRKGRTSAAEATVDFMEAQESPEEA
jgi:putative sigma-54 modulation protein